MSGIAAIHDPLRNVYARAGQVLFVVYVLNQVDRSAMDSHPQRQMRRAT